MSQSKSKTVAIVLGKIGTLRHFLVVVRLLLEAGHEVVVCVRRRDSMDGLEEQVEALNKHPRFRVHDCRVKTMDCHPSLVSLHNRINYGLFFRREHPSPHLNGRILERLPLLKRLPAFIQKIYGRYCARASARESWRQELLVLPVLEEMVELLREWKPDLVLGSPLIMPGSPMEAEFLRAAKSLGIPTVYALASWDNLSTKGGVHCEPDRVLVWNAALRTEAIQVHDLAEDKIRVTGSPSFDYLFEDFEPSSREAFCRRCGLDPARPIALYLGSSSQITADESRFFERFYDELRSVSGMEKVQVLIRPHPLNSEPWMYLRLPDTALWPRSGETPTTRVARRNYLDSLNHCFVVVGINTSSILEAAIYNKPCISVLADCFKHMQKELGHYQHLRTLVQECEDGVEAAALMQDVLEGRDRGAQMRREFVSSFLKPRADEGLASEVFVKELLSLIDG